MATITFDAMKRWAEKMAQEPYAPNPIYVSPTHAEWLKKYIGHQYGDWPREQKPMHYTDKDKVREVHVTIDGTPVLVSHISCTRESAQRGTRVSIDGFLSDESRRRERPGQYGSSMTADEFLSVHIGKHSVGKEVDMREATQGSYAYGVAQLSEGLSRAVAEGWITDEEAKTEFRANVDSVNRADKEAQYAAERIEMLEKELEELEKTAAKTS